MSDHQHMTTSHHIMLAKSYALEISPQLHTEIFILSQFLWRKNIYVNLRMRCACATLKLDMAVDLKMSDSL